MVRNQCQQLETSGKENCFMVAVVICQAAHVEFGFLQMLRQYLANIFMFNINKHCLQFKNQYYCWLINFIDERIINSIDERIISVWLQHRYCFITDIALCMYVLQMLSCIGVKKLLKRKNYSEQTIDNFQIKYYFQLQEAFVTVENFYYQKQTKVMTFLTSQMARFVVYTKVCIPFDVCLSGSIIVQKVIIIELFGEWFERTFQGYYLQGQIILNMLNMKNFS
eukprot:TRINITY_DN7781_c0_g2_i2.p1 TRINITY_DN7781_c0_g2~~TRINITY_DN7781_c0_g2_i2.p1  ORF type:complete len:223 (-),score=-10.54 TRINITY_DN7781_c0_g2_i2:355-1023(-)